MTTRPGLTKKTVATATLWLFLLTRALPAATLAVGASMVASGSVATADSFGCPASPIGSPVTGDRLPYYGGSVQHAPTFYAIFWLPGGHTYEPIAGNDSLYEQTIDQFLVDTSGTNLAGVVSQYYSCSNGTQDTLVQASQPGFGDDWVDTRAYNTGDGNDGSAGHPLTDADIQNEVQHAIDSNPGWQEGINSTFFVFLGSEVNMCFVDTQGQNNCTPPVTAPKHVCGYHRNFTANSGTTDYYAAIPDAGTLSGCPFITGPNSLYRDSTIAVLTHELFEAETSPGADQLAAGWTDAPTGGLGEVADQCENSGGPDLGYSAYNTGHGFANTKVGNDYYELPQLWSNLDGRCAGFNPGPTGFRVTYGDFVAYAGQSTGEIRLAESDLLMAGDSIDWGDGSSSSPDRHNPDGIVGDCNLSSNCFLDGSHTYSSPGTYRVNLSYGVVCRTPGCIIENTSTYVVVLPSQTSLAYTGDTSQDFNDATTLSAKLTGSGGGGVANKTVNFQLGSQTCSGTTDGSGNASCTISPISVPPGSYSVKASFAGDTSATASSTTSSYTVNREDTRIAYAGATSGEYNDAVTVSATLTDPTDSTGISGKTVTFTLDNAETCSAMTQTDGTVSCSITPQEAAGNYTLAVSFGGDSDYAAASASPGFTVNLEDTLVTYTGASHQHFNDAVTVSATLTDPTDGTAISGKTVTFTLNNAETCSATTLSDGSVSCSITPQESAGKYQLQVSFAGDSKYAASSGKWDFTVDLEDTKVTYTGPTSQDYNDPVTVSATLTDRDDGTAISGKSVTFTLNGAETCTATTHSDGTVSCSITPKEKAGGYTLAVSFGGDSDYAAATASPGFTVNLEEDTLTASTAFQVLPDGHADTLTSVLKEDGTTGIQGRSVTMTLGSGANAVSCTAVTGSSGTASCPVTPSAALQGSQTIRDNFTSEGYYQSASNTQQSVVFGFLASGSFLLGDKTVAGATSTTLVNWWGAQWSKNNAVTHAPNLAGLKGFATAATPAPPACSGTWRSPANTTPVPPVASSIPTYMAVVVTSNVTLSGTMFSGNVSKIVIVRTVPGYQPNPGHSGYGTIVATYCG